MEFKNIRKRVRAINGRGFTLIELLIVIAIIAILASMAIPYYIKYQQKSKVSSYAEPYARACLTDLIAFCTDHHGQSIDINIVNNLANCKKIIGLNGTTPDKNVYVVFTDDKAQSDISGSINWTKVVTGSTISGIIDIKYVENYSIYVDNLACTNNGELEDQNGKSVDITTRLVYVNNQEITQIGPYFAECSYYPGKGIKCMVTDNPVNE